MSSINRKKNTNPRQSRSSLATTKATIPIQPSNQLNLRSNTSSSSYNSNRQLPTIHRTSRISHRSNNNTPTRQNTLSHNRYSITPQKSNIVHPYATNAVTSRLALTPTQNFRRMSDFNQNLDVIFDNTTGQSPQELQRRSSIYIRGPPITMPTSADPRRTGNRDFQRHCINTLYQFLINHKYDQPITIQNVSNPMSHQIKSFISFIFRQIDHNFESNDGNFEEETRTFFRFSGYPYSIPHSAFKHLCSPLSWSSLLAAIEWLVSSINMAEKYDARPDEIKKRLCKGDYSEFFQDGLSGLDQNHVLYEYVRRLYKQWMENSDKTITIDAKLDETLSQKENELTSNIAKIQKENELIMEQIQGESDPDGLILKLQNDILKLQQDLASLRDNTPTLKDDETKWNQEVRKKNQISRLHEEEIASLQAEKEILQKETDNQTITMDDINRMQEEKKTLEHSSALITRQCEEITSTITILEEELSLSHTKLKENIAQYNARIKNLGLRPHYPLAGEIGQEIANMLSNKQDPSQQQKKSSTQQNQYIYAYQSVTPTENLSKDLALELGAYPEKGHDGLYNDKYRPVLSQDIYIDIIPRFNSYRNYARQRHTTIELKISEMEGELKRLELAKIHDTEKMNLTKQKAAKKEEAADEENKKWRKELEELVDIVDMKNKEIVQLKSQAHNPGANPEQQVQQLTSSFEEMKLRHTEERKQLHDIICTVNDQVTTHLKKVTERLRKMEQTTDEAKRSIINKELL